MRRPRDYDAELKALDDKARQLKQRKVQQLGELVIATGADALDPETLAGALLKTMEAADAPRKESWRKRGTEFFAGRGRGRSGRTGNPGAARPGSPAPGPSHGPGSTLAPDGNAQPAPGGPRAS